MSLNQQEKDGFFKSKNSNLYEDINTSNGFIFQNKEEIENEIKNMIFKNDEDNSKIYIESFDVIRLIHLPLPFPESIEQEKKEIEGTYISNNSTENKSEITVNKCLFETKFQKRIEQRVDYAIKNIKVHIIQYLKNQINHLIISCYFPKNLEKLKLFSPSYKYFTGNSNEKNNKIFLDFTVEKIFCHPEEKLQKNDNRLQRKNKEIIQAFKQYINDNYPIQMPYHFQKLINYFNMTFKDVIIQFYDSPRFNDYISSLKAKFLDEQFIKVKGFSLLEKNGFFKWLNKL